MDKTMTPKPKKREKEFYTTYELARIMGVCPTTIFRAVQNGKIKSVKTPGGQNRFREKEVKRFLKRNGF